MLIISKNFIFLDKPTSMKILKAIQIFVLFLFLLSTPSKSQEVNLSALKIPAELKENANAVVRLDQKDIKIISQRAMVITEKRVVTILNEYGLSNINAVEYYDKNRKIKRIEATVYNGLGVLIKSLKRKDFKDVSVGDGFSVFTDNRMLYFDYTPVSYPFTVVYESEIETSNTAFLPNWAPFDDYYISSEKRIFNFTYPTALGFDYKETNFSDKYKIVKEENEGFISYTADTIKALKWEENNPEFSKLVPLVYMRVQKFNLEGVDGEAKNWKDFGKWYYDTLLLNTDELSLETQSKVKELIGSETDSRTIAKIIYHFVQQKTRYVSIQVGIGGFKPMLAKDVDRLGYGDCKALVNYTRSLLKVAGVTSYYTIVHSGANKKSLHDDFASVQGNHIILAVPYKDDFIWLECTNQILPFGFQGDFTDDRKVVIIKPEGGELVKTKVFVNNDNSQFTKGTYTITPNGDITAGLSIVSKGIQYDDSYSHERLSAEEKDKHYKSYFAAINNLKINSLSFNNDSENIAFTQNIKLSATSYADANNNKLIFVINAFNNNQSTPRRYRTRENAFEISRGYFDIDEIEIVVPMDYVVEAIPNNLEIKNKFGEYQMELISKGQNQFVYKRKLLIKEGAYESKEYEEYRLFREQVAKNDNAKIVLTKKS